MPYSSHNKAKPSQNSTGKVIHIAPHVKRRNRAQQGQQAGAKQASLQEPVYAEKRSRPARKGPATGITVIPILALVLSFAMAAYVVLRDNTEDQKSSTSVEQDKTDALSAADVERLMTQSKGEPSKGINLEHVALKIVRTESWNEQDILQVALAWQKYSANQKNKLRETVWFQLLENSITQRVLLYHNKKATNNLDRTDKQKQKLLLGLAKNLDVSIPELKNNRAQVEVKRLRSKAEMQETKKSLSINTETKIVNDEATKNTALQLQVPNVLLPKHEVAHMDPAQDGQGAAPAVSNELLGKVTAKLTKVPVAMKKPTAAQLDAVTVQFVDAYESGDISKFTSLFALDAFSNNQNNLSAIKSEYETLFNSTSERQMFLQNLKWKYSGSKAVGKAKLKVVIMTHTGADVSSFSGRIQFVVEKQDDAVVITKLFHLLDK